MLELILFVIVGAWVVVGLFTGAVYAIAGVVWVVDRVRVLWSRRGPA